ncbi:histidine phosphatase family protein [Lactobacillus sp. DCY120]|uniref:Histidine phosphatase family protein n=1 Tax=Bombilactobacillus apium TaxID=2675299 RepID=A0A850R3F4_9LACO|nr:histidine phosphatase family protein [Bombilactobacillus apium]NVY96501.1 histidine phosphatase family protein [Bombilactobacillus apium]
MINVYVVRHGQTDTNKSKKINGATTDLPLNDTGIAEAQALRASWDPKKIDYVYSSPLIRAVQTANIIMDQPDQLEIDDRLTELNYGSWDGAYVPPLKEKYPQAFDGFGYLNDQYSNYCTGEGYAHLAQRLAPFWQDLVSQHAGQNVLVVCHGAVSRALVQNALQVPKIMQIVQMKNTGVVNLAYDETEKFTSMRYYNRLAPADFFLD